MLNMQVDPWVPPCVLFGWWITLWELWGRAPVSYTVVLPMGLQSISDSSALALACPLGSLGMAASIHICIVQALDGLSFSLCFILCPHIPLDKSNFEKGVWPHLSTVVSSYPFRMFSAGSISTLLVISSNVIPIVSIF